MIRILHTADLHLDKVFFGENPKLSALRRKEQRALFANLMMYACDRKVDVLLIAGDLLDRPVPEEETGRLLLREFENTPDTEIFISPGQNDPMRPGSFWALTQFPSNVHVFSSERMTKIDIDRLNLSVFGYAFCHKKMARSPFAALPEVDRSRFNLLCGYASLEGDEGCCPVTPEQIAQTGVDYAALGHAHTAVEPTQAGETFYGVSGSPEGLSFDEPGVRGVRIAAMEKANGQLLFRSKSVPFSRRRFERVSLSADGEEDCGKLASRLTAIMKEKGFDADTLLEVEITGRVPVSFRLREEAFEKPAEKLCFLSLKDATVMVCPEESDERTFRSVFAGIVKKKTDDELLRSKILKCGFESLEHKRT